MYLNELIETYTNYINRVNAIKNSIEEVLTSKGYDISDKSFLGLANVIYNIGNDEELSFIDQKFDTIPTESGEKGLEVKIDKLSFVKLSLFNVLRAKGIEIESNTPFDEYDIYIDSVTSPDRILPLNILSEKTDNYNETKLTVEQTEGYNYYYNLSGLIPVYGKVYNSENGFKSFTDVISVPENQMFISVIEVDENNLVTKAGVVICEHKIRRIADLINIDMTPGNHLYECIFTPSVSNVDIYYKNFNFYDSIYQDEIFDSTDYTLYSDSYISESGEDHQLFIVLVKDNRSIGYYIGSTNIRKAAYRFDSYSLQGEQEGYTKIYTENILKDGDKYLLYKGEKTPLYDEYINPDSCIIWNGEDELELEHRSLITILEVDSNNKIKKYSLLSVSANVQLATSLTGITSVAGSNDYHTIISIKNMKEDYSYYYKASDSYVMPVLNSKVPTGYIQFLPGEDELNIENGTRVCILEVKDGVESAGYHTVESRVPTIKYIKLESTIGSIAGYTKISTDNELEEDEYYMYQKGCIATAYNKDPDGFIRFNIDNELYGFNDFDNITVLVVKMIEGEYKVRKVGYTTVNVRPVELLPLTIISRRGSLGEHTYISVSPYITRGNVYKYQFTSELPVLYQDVSNWFDWDGKSEIKSENDVDICIAECSSDYLVLKTGKTKVKAKDPDPVLGELTITSEAGTNDGCTKITVEPSLTEGYQYAYQFDIETLPEYHHDASTWYAWNGTSEIKATNGKSICIAECTIDGFITKAGITTVISK